MTHVVDYNRYARVFGEVLRPPAPPSGVPWRERPAICGAAAGRGHVKRFPR
jgi:hypothetical protein